MGPFVPFVVAQSGSRLSQSASEEWQVPFLDVAGEQPAVAAVEASAAASVVVVVVASAVAVGGAEAPD